MRFVGLRYKIYRIPMEKLSDSVRRPRASQLFEDPDEISKDSIISVFGGAVKAIETVVDDKGMRIGNLSAISYCSTGDQFDLEVGKTIAFLRLAKIKVFFPYFKE